MLRWQKAAAGAMVLGFVGASVTAAAGPVGANKPPADTSTTTPIKHLVVIFQENVSFDHYFGTYPSAQNNAGETPFHPSRRTPKSPHLRVELRARRARARVERTGC